MSAVVSLQWAWITLQPTDTWSVVLAKLKAEEIREKQLSRSVYAIRIAARFGIKYPKGVSPVLYVGEGRLKQRVDAHRKWLADLEAVFGRVKLQIAVATPRVRNNSLAYKETEAALIQFFLKKYGSAPLKNSHIERQKFGHKFAEASLAEALCPGSGTRYTWAIEPTKINPFHSVYTKTHQKST